MANDVMTYILEGRDRLSRVLDNAGDSAGRLRRQLDDVGDSSRSLDRVERSSRRARASMTDLKVAAVGLGAGLVPIAASLVPIAAQAGAASVAMAAFGAAVIPQISAMSDASKAQDKYTKAVRQHGPASQQAASAENEYLAMVQKMPPATRKAAAALSVFKDTFRSWSDSLAGNTMPAFTASLEAAGALLPRLTGVTKGASTQLQRLMTLAAGGFASPGFDRLMGKFTTFTNGVLQKATDAIIHFFRVVSEGNASGLNKVLDYAHRVGPQVADTLKNLARAVGNILEGAAQAGGGMLMLANALAKVVAALPPRFVALILQMALAFKIASLAGKGMAAVGAVMAAVRVEIAAASVAATGATTRLGALRLAFAALGKTAKLTIAATGIGLLLVALTELAGAAETKGPSIDKLTTSLGQLGRTGKATGYVASQFGKDFAKLRAEIQKVVDPSVTESINNWGESVSGGLFKAGEATEKFRKDADAIDKALANLVSSGKAEQAKIALENMLKTMSPAQVKKFTGELDDYKSALADAKFEQQLAAQSMGLFGQQAVSVQQKLAAQKQSADGLRQSIQALNDVQRQGLGGMIGFEASIDAATKAAKENAGALKMSHGELNLNSEKARNAATALQDLASKTDEAAGSARESGKSWSTVNGIYARGRQQLIANAMQMGLNRDQAKKLADQILKTPNKTARLKGDMQDLQAKLDKSRKQLKSLPDSRQAKVRADIRQAEAALARIKMQLAAIKGKTVSVTTVYKSLHVSSGSSQSRKNYAETYRSRGGPVPGYAGGGHVQAFPGGGLVQGPGSSSSDSILGLFSGGAARVSDREYVVRAAAVRKYGVGFLDRLNSMSLGTAGAGVDAARGLAAGLLGGSHAVMAAAGRMASGALQGVRKELQIASPSKKMKALGAETGNGMIVGLTGTQSKIKSTAEKLAKDIWSTFSGRTDNRLAGMVNSGSKRLQSLAGSRDSLASRIDTAKKYAADLATSARSSAALPNVGSATVTAGGVQKFLADKLNLLTKFKNLVNTLGRKGLNKTLLREILDMGPEAGYPYALALSKASAGSLKSINSLQYRIDSASTSLGRAGADMLYDSGKQAGRGFLAGLEGQKKSIENLMLSIAKGMQKSIRKALGIHSPSRVMARLGHFTAEGLAQGMYERTPFVERASRSLAEAAANARPRTVVPARGLAFAGAGAGPSTTNHNTYHLYQRDMTVSDLEALDRRREARARIGRPR